MDIVGLSMAMSQAELLNNVGTAVLAKTLDQAEATGTAMAKLLEEPNLDPLRGHNIDLSI